MLRKVNIFLLVLALVVVGTNVPAFAEEATVSDNYAVAAEASEEVPMDADTSEEDSADVDVSEETSADAEASEEAPVDTEASEEALGNEETSEDASIEEASEEALADEGASEEAPADTETSEEALVDAETSEDTSVEEVSEEVVVDEEVVLENAGLETRYVSEETDTGLVEPLGAESSEEEDIFSNGCYFEANVASAAKKVYYGQYEYLAKTGYDIIEVYVAKDGKYTSRLFFIHDHEYNEWLRYDYGKMAADTFLAKYEKKVVNGVTLYIPVAKTSGGKKVFRSDIKGTAINETKIPVIAADKVDGINYAWKALSKIPFSKSGSAYVYAYTTPAPAPVLSKGKYTATINGNKYVVKWTYNVTYDGRKHVRKGVAKTSKAQVADVAVNVYRNGKKLAASKTAVTFKNNVHVNGYAGKSSYKPYFTVKLKDNAKDSKVLAKVKMPFKINARKVSAGKFQAKITTKGNKVTIKKMYFVFPDGRKTAISFKTKSNPGGAYTATVKNGKLTVKGAGDLKGSKSVKLKKNKTTTYKW